MGVTWDGLEELKDNLEHLAPDLANDAGVITEEAANKAAEAIRAGYPKRSGYLAGGVYVRNTTRAPLKPRWTVANDVIYANVFETGSMARHTATDTPGSKPAGKVFVPTSIRERRSMFTKIAALLRTYGAIVSES